MTVFLEKRGGDCSVATALADKGFEWEAVRKDIDDLRLCEAQFPSKAATRESLQMTDKASLRFINSLPPALVVRGEW
jgi:hypothetical protein